MGVRRLTRFIRENDDSNNITDEVDLRRLADQWRDTGGQAIIVMDGINFAHILFSDMNFLCGGELKMISHKLERVIDAFQAISIELVFFVDGPVEEDKLPNWISRRKQNMDEYHEIFRNIERFPVSALKVEAMPCVPIMREAIISRCKVIPCVEDPDQEMARYVVENKCLGIFSGDTDFLIFPGIPNVFLAGHTNFETMTTRAYNGNTLAQCLRVRPQALPIFATLMGNDMITFEDATRYHRRRFNRVPFLRVVMGLAEKANDIETRSGGNLESAALYLAEEIFQRRDLKNVTLDSLRTYNYYMVQAPPVPPGNDHWELIKNRCRQEYRKCKLHSQTLSVIKNQRYNQVSRFEDTQSSCVLVLSGLRRRMYSVLLHEKPVPRGRTKTVDEFCAAGPGSLDRRTVVGTVKVEVEHPGLLRLWDSDESANEFRWKLVWWTLFGSGSRVDYEAVSGLKRLSHQLLHVASVLLYLTKVTSSLSEQEVTALAVMAASVPEMEWTELSSERFSVKSTTKRAVTVATLYQQTWYNVQIVFAAYGLPLRSKSYDCYSGQLFHCLLQKSVPTDFFTEETVKAHDSYDLLRSVLDECAAA